MPSVRLVGRFSGVHLPDICTSSKSIMSQPTKLTLRLDAELISRAKNYALEHERSVSQLVADYFAHLAPPSKHSVSPQRGSARPSAGPLTRGLRGALRATSKSRALPGRADYRAHLEKKYL